MELRLNCTTYIAKFVQISEQLVRFSKHQMTLNLNFLQRLHKALHTHKPSNLTS